MQPSDDRHGKGLAQLGIQQLCRDPLILKNGHPAHPCSAIDEFALADSIPDMTT